MNMTQHHGEWNILKGSEAVGTLQQWTQGMGELVTKTAHQVGRISKATLALFSPRTHVSSMRVAWAGVLRSDHGQIVPESSEEVRFQVANQMFLCGEGKKLVFDDTWNPDAWHETNGYRVVFKTDSTQSAKRPWHRLRLWFTNLGRH